MKKIFVAIFGTLVLCTALFAKGMMSATTDVFYAETFDEKSSANEEAHPHYEYFHDDSETIFLDRVNS